jgi:hypothetical protein
MYVITGEPLLSRFLKTQLISIYLLLKTGSSIAITCAAAGTAVPRESVGG